MARPTASFAPSATATTTVTIENLAPSSSSQNTTLVLKLNRKKSVSWKEGTVDNEFMQKKSSKKCCIFHKQKSFDEDYSSDEDGGDDRQRPDGDHHHHGRDACGSCSNDSDPNSANIGQTN
ncbi:hypothetical protein SAY87_000165 [Trapa incisa]|uniref:Uncharacterized protein n=2 Tax=Trapa TaxID=22665 RepID=A0AAN7RM01_TRANT|nr:hypothetical protein SAY87_000165 [Trapa incisa]KAK4801303.1 hypothetical protein SAY86_021790 [Trapa natans]